MCVHTEWLGTGALQKVVLVVSSALSKEVLERWTFDIQTNKTAINDDRYVVISTISSKTIKTIFLI